MRRGQFTLLPWLALLAFPAVWIVATDLGATDLETRNSPPSREAAQVAVSGVYTLRMHLHLPATLPPGAALLCKARVTPNAPPPRGFPALLPTEQAIYATRAGSNANCEIPIPFSWVVENATSGAALSYEIDAAAAVGAQPAPIRSQQGIRLGYPPPGAATSLELEIAF